MSGWREAEGEGAMPRYLPLRREVVAAAPGEVTTSPRAGDSDAAADDSSLASLIILSISSLERYAPPPLGSSDVA